jgi:hypothetical protein
LQCIFVLLVGLGLLPPFFDPIALFLSVSDIIKEVILYVKTFKKGKIMNVESQHLEDINISGKKSVFGTNLLKVSWNLRWWYISTRTLIQKSLI